MKIYLCRDGACMELIRLIYSGDVDNITVRVSNRPYVLVEVYGRPITTVELIKKLGCREYEFPKKGDNE